MDLSEVNALEQEAAYERAEARLREEVERTVDAGIWSHGSPARASLNGKQFVAGPFGVCAIGALVVNAQVDPKSCDYDQVVGAARVLGVSEDWAAGVFIGVCWMNKPEILYFEQYKKKVDPGYEAGYLVGMRLRAYADRLKAEKAAA